MGKIDRTAAAGRAVALPGRRLLVDSISGLGGDGIDLGDGNVSICVGVANKCIQGLPGIGSALEEAHYPSTFPSRDEALRRLAFDELVALL